MYLNTIKPAKGSKKPVKRLGRGIGSGLGKTSGRGHKGQHARAGGFHKLGFEGGQMPMQRRLPKFGFKSHLNKNVRELTLEMLDKINADEINLSVLKELRVVKLDTEQVRVLNSVKFKLSKPLNLQGLYVTAGARKAIEAAGGKVAE